MLKKTSLLFAAVCFAIFFSSCGAEEEVSEEEKDNWAGRYVMVNEDTEEFKVLNVVSETETEVVMSFESVRSSNEFTGTFKSSSGKYAVCNAGDRCLKFNLKSGNTVIAVDDIWINSDKKRNENWSGKYVMLEDGEEPEKYGDKSWNGEYASDENGLDMSVYAIKENTVLLTYTDAESPENEKVNLKCTVSDENPKEAVYEDGGRKVTVTLKKSNAAIEIEDLSEDDESGNGIGGKYIKK